MAYGTSPFLSACLLFLPFVLAQTKSNISIGTSITAGDNSVPWLSPSNDFAMGFHQLENQPSFFLLAIWYHNIPSRTIVWYANGDNPAPRRSKMELTADRGLVLSDPDNQLIWRSDFPSSEVKYAIMNDTGNFVIYGEDTRLWESFANPTDTILPTQVMETKSVLSSRKKENNFTKGRFQFRLLEDGNAVLNTINMESNNADEYAAYYLSGTKDSNNSSNSGYKVMLDEEGNFFVMRRNNQNTSLGLVSSTNSYHRVTLNFDGVLTLSYHPKKSNSNDPSNWTVIKAFPDNICMSAFSEIGSGTCGFNSICTLKADSRPSCQCPQNYSLSDPSDEYGDCKADFMQGCAADNQSSPQNPYHLLELQNTDWPTSDYELIRPCSFENCKLYCLQDCLCAVAVSIGSDCVKKSLPLSFGRNDGQLKSISLLKVRKPEFFYKNPPSVPNIVKKKKNSLITLFTALLGTSAFVNFVLVGVLCTGSVFLYKKKIARNHNNRICTPNNPLRSFSYRHLEEATNGFTEELGRGSFGIVYKGHIKTESQNPIQVAVKKLDRLVQENDKEFKTEVSVIAQIHHKNLVSLIGYCQEAEYRMLVYEYLSNGTLAGFLFGCPKPRWNKRTRIALGIARGLIYLHEDCSPQIIHCDIKPQNILLDDYYEARISDFGLSKLLGVDKSFTTTAIRGTKGYVAPEWFKTVPVTVKVDVYSFGVLLLEIICCRKNVAEMDGDEVHKAILTDWACDCFMEGALEDLVDGDAEALCEKETLERFVMVAIWCIQEDWFLRPTMKKVLLMLEGLIQVPPPPCPLSMPSVVQN